MKPENPTPRWREAAVTLLEMLVVVLIISILATIATGVYTNQTRRARVAATRDLINQLQIAITRYETDLGSFPLSGSSSTFPPAAITATNTTRRDGSGLLQLALVHSMTGSALAPASTLWQGPYINLQAEQIATNTGGAAVAGNYDVLDAFGGPILYVRSEDYVTSDTTGKFTGGTRMFSGFSGPISGANPALPTSNPYAQGETFYNPSTYQLISYGPDGVTLTVSGVTYRGAAADDITNFGY